MDPNKNTKWRNQEERVTQSLNCAFQNPKAGETKTLLLSLVQLQMWMCVILLQLLTLTEKSDEETS